MTMNIDTVILISLLVMRSTLEVTGAFFYHNLCAPNLWLHPTEWHHLSGGVTQFSCLQDLSLGYPPALSHWPELLIKAVLRGASVSHESLGFLRLSVPSPLCCSRTFFPWKSGSATSGNTVIPSLPVRSKEIGVNTNYQSAVSPSDLVKSWWCVLVEVFLLWVQKSEYPESPY